MPYILCSLVEVVDPFTSRYAHKWLAKYGRVKISIHMKWVDDDKKAYKGIPDSHHISLRWARGVR